MRSVSNSPWTTKETPLPSHPATHLPHSHTHIHVQDSTAVVYDLYIKLTAFGYLFAIDVLHIKVFSSTRTHTQTHRRTYIETLKHPCTIYYLCPHMYPLCNAFVCVCLCKKSETSTRPRPQTKRTHTITKLLHVRVSLMPVCKCVCEWVERSSLGGWGGSVRKWWGGGTVRVRQQRNIVNRLQNKYENF